MLHDMTSQRVARQEFDHKAVEEPWLFDLTGVTSTGKYFQFATANALLEFKGTFMSRIFGPGKDNRGTRDALVMVVSLALLQCLKLI